MKKIFAILLILGLFISPVLADRNVATIKGFTTSQLVKRGDGKVYSITFIATANNGEFAIHDVASMENAVTGDVSTTIKAEGKEATSGNSEFYNHKDKPLEFSTGIYLYIVSGTVVIEYD